MGAADPQTVVAALMVAVSVTMIVVGIVVALLRGGR